MPQWEHLLERSYTAFGSLYEAIDLVNAFLLVPFNLHLQDKDHSVLLLSYLRTMLTFPCSNTIVCRDLDCLDLTQNMKTIHYLDVIRLTGPCKQKVASALGAPVSAYVLEGNINPMKIQVSAILVISEV